VKTPSYNGSPTLDEMLKRFQADPDNFKPDMTSVEKMGVELEASRSKYDNELKEYERHGSQESSHRPIFHDVIDMGPDWYTRKITPAKIKWHIDRGLSIEQVAEKLNRSVKAIEKTFAKIGQLPVEKPIKEVPYGWKLTKDKYRPDETEQWVIKKIGDDHASGKNLDDIAKELMKVGIKPRGGGLWFRRRLATVQKENAQMWADYKLGKSLPFEKGRIAPGPS